MSADYDKIVEFFEDVDSYLNRLKILEKWVLPVPELKMALTDVLASVLVLCDIYTKYVKIKRFGNWPLPACFTLNTFPEDCLTDTRFA